MALPSDLSGLALWLRAGSLALSNGAAVSSWADESGGGLTVAQSTAGAKPTYIASGLNGLPVVRFDGGDYLTNAAAFTATGAGGWTAFVVAKLTSAVNAWALFDGSGNGFAVGVGGDGVHRELLLRGQADVTGGSYTPSTWEIWCGTRTTGGTSTLFVNATSDATSGAGYSDAAGGLTVGAFEGGGGAFFVGDIAEVVAYSRNLTAFERAQIGQYLATKYGLTIADAVVSPAVVAAVTSVPAAAAAAGSVASPAAVAAVTSVPAQAARAGSTASPAAVAALTSVPAAASSAGSTAAPAAVATVASVPGPAVATGSIVSPAAVRAVAGVPATSITGTPTSLRGRMRARAIAVATMIRRAV